MAVCETYSDRLDLVTHGYVKDYINHNDMIPTEIIELIKTWHSNNESPKLIFNVLTISIFGHEVIFECYFDKPHWNILSVNKYSLTYDVMVKNDMLSDSTVISAKSTGIKSIEHFYEEEHSLAFCKISVNRDIINKPKIANCTLMCFDSHDNVICKADITREYTYGEDVWFLGIEFEKIDPNGKGTISFDEWVSLKDKLSIQCKDFLWKRIFYFGNYMAERTGDYHLNDVDLRVICETDYSIYSEAYERALDKLRLACDDEWELRFDHETQ